MPVGRFARALSRLGKVPDSPLQWRLSHGPWYDNNLAVLELAPAGIRIWWNAGTVVDADGYVLTKASELRGALDVPPREDDHVELKFIASRYDTQGNDFSINLNVGWATEHRRERESEISLGFLHPERPGMGHREPGLKYGLEFSEGLEEHNAVLGPTVGFRASEHFHLLGTFAFGLNHKEDNTLRLIAEWEF